MLAHPRDNGNRAQRLSSCRRLPCPRLVLTFYTYPVVLAIAAVSARSVALAGFGLDSVIEIGASTVVIWELSGSGRNASGGDCG
jgi:hypothetical protein